MKNLTQSLVVHNPIPALKSDTVGFYLSFNDEWHQKYHDLLVALGFSFEVGADFKIGTIYHFRKHIHTKVILEEDIEEDNPTGYEVKILIRKFVQDGSKTKKEWFVPFNHFKPSAEDYYTQAEWKWLQLEIDSENRTYKNEFLERIQRELYIITKVRPHSLNSFINTKAVEPEKKIETKLAPLSKKALAVLKELSEKDDLPRNLVNPAMCERFDRENLIEVFMLPSEAHNGKLMPHIRITSAGLEVLIKAAQK